MTDTIDKHPLLSRLWDEAKNGAASGVQARGYRPVWWRCENGHAFERSPRAMVSDPTCPTCKLGSKRTSLADVSPHLVAMWHADKNGALSPATVEAAHAGSVWWRCPKGHDFERAPLLMARDTSCPLCAAAEKSLGTTHPNVAAEWHPTKNGALKPSQVDADHVMNAWWLCPNGHEYQATVRSRVVSDQRRRVVRRAELCGGIRRSRLAVRGSGRA